MRVGYLLVRDFFSIALGTWLILLFFELMKPGMVHRLVNLEYGFYGLCLVYIVLRILQK